MLQLALLIFVAGRAASSTFSYGSVVFVGDSPLPIIGSKRVDSTDVAALSLPDDGARDFDSNSLLPRWWPAGFWRTCCCCATMRHAKSPSRLRLSLDWKSAHFSPGVISVETTSCCCSGREELALDVIRSLPLSGRSVTVRCKTLHLF